MKKCFYLLLCAVLAFSCVGQIDDPEEEPVVDPSGPGVTPGEEDKDGEGYFRRNLILDFTGTWCVNCPRMEEAIKEAQAMRPGRLECISVHCLTADKLSLLPKSRELAAQFNVSAYPSAVIDMDAGSLTTTTSAELLLAQCDRLLDQRPQAAGIKISSSFQGTEASISIEARTVRAGSYSLHCILVEDGVIAAQVGGSDEHVHNNVLRYWQDSEASEKTAGSTLEWSITAPATKGWRVVAVVCRNGIVDNVCSCKLGESSTPLLKKPLH